MSSFLGTAVSRKDGSNADGIHLLWTAPYAAGYSAKGFDIQRRLSKGDRKVECYTLTTSDLETLYRDYRVKTPPAIVGVSKTACPDFPSEPPDEPYKDGEPPRDGGEETCIDFQSFAAGKEDNPRTEKGATLLVRDSAGAAEPYSVVEDWTGFKGLNCGATLEINFTTPVSQVVATLVHSFTPAELEGFSLDGSSVGKISTSDQKGVVQTAKLRGSEIKRVVIRAPKMETLLLKVCFSMSRLKCVDFQTQKTGFGDNPRKEADLVFEVRDNSQTEIVSMKGFTGLQCGLELNVRLPFKVSMVEITLVSLGKPAKVTAFDAQEKEAGTASMSARTRGAETLQINGKDIQRVLIDAPADETLLLAICYANIPSIEPSLGRGKIGMGAEIRADVGPFIEGTGTGRGPRGGGDKDGSPSVFPLVSRLEHGSGQPLMVPSQTVTNLPQGCVRYDIDLKEPHEFVSVAMLVSGAFAIAMREGKAVDSKQSADPSGTQLFRFENRRIDQILVYVSQAARGLTICTDAGVRPKDEDTEWAGVPFIAKGIQLPVKSINNALGSDADEDALASSRLFAGEIFDNQSFRSVAELLNQASSDASVTSPVWHTMLTREDVQDPFIELRPWHFALSLLTNAEWRRILGFAFLDKGAGLTDGSVYDYRITGHFRYRDLKEEVLGFHSIPTGTTLPSTFHIDSTQFNSYAPAVVEIVPSVLDTAVSGIGRKGIALSESGFGGRSLAITFPSAVKRVVLEMEPGAPSTLTYEAATSEYFFAGLSGSLFNDTIPTLNRVEIDFPEPISTLRLLGKGFLYSVRAPVEARPAGTTPDDLIDDSIVLHDVRYESTPAPAPPPFLGTTNLQEPMIPGDPALTTQNPPRSLGFQLQWLPPPIGGSAPTPWPPDLAAFPPFDVLSFDIERRRVDTGGPFVEIDEQKLPTMFFGSRSSRRDPPQVHYGIDLLEAYAENPPPRPPISVFMDAEDVLDSAKKRADGPTSPPGSLHQYRIRSIDAIGRRSTVATLGSVVRLEKHLPPPQPVSPAPLPLAAGAPQPSGLRARILQAPDPELTAADLALLGPHTNAIVFEWGWRSEERTQDPYATEFRVYWQPLPPDIIHGSLTGTATAIGAFFEMTANLDQAVSANQMASRYLRAGDYPFKVASHTGGQAITIRFEKSQVDATRIPTAADFEFHPILKGDELRPSGWAERVEIRPLTTAQEYSIILHDRLTLDATHTNVRVWLGVSAADGQPYIADELPASAPNGGRPGNESSIAAAAASARYIGRPTFTVPLPLPDVPEQVTDEPAAKTIAVNIDLPALLPAVVIPPAHKVKIERISFAVLTPLVSANSNDTIGVELPGAAPTSYTLGNPTDHANFLAQIRAGIPGRVENKFLVDFVLRFLPQLETLWVNSQPEPVPFSTVTDTLSTKAERYIHRLRLVDAAGHISAGSAILPQVVRVPSLSPPAAPEFKMADSENEVLTIEARVHDSYEIKWVALFSLVSNAGTPPDPRMLEKPQLLRLPNRRDIYPNDGLRLRLRDGTLLAPEAFAVSTGVLQLPDRLLSIARPVGHEKRVAVWLVSLTRDGIASRFSGPRIANTGPVPLVVPILTVTPGTNVDQASWTTLTVPAQVTIERSVDGGVTWSRVTAWLAANTTSYEIPRFGTAPRRYRLVLRNNSGQSLIGVEVSLA